MWEWVAGSGAAAAAAAGVTAYGIAAPSAQLFAPSVCRGPGRRRSIALTFDDGPSPATPELLDFLARQSVRATFFQCGRNVERHPEIARAALSAGHELGNHTDSHPRLYLRSPRFIDREFTRAQRIIQDATGATPRLLRAPYGLRWLGMRATQRKLNLLGVMWTVLGHDWEWPASRVADRVLGKASPGAIVCLHDGRSIRPEPDVSAMLGAVKLIVPVFKDQGYSFETVSDLLIA
jgi:peptidoglycan/xylan/chitin deacetylase (PgdA/CDA1 family)